MCYREPLVEIIDKNGSYMYGEIDEDKAAEIIEKHFKENKPIKDYVVRADTFRTIDNTFTD